MVNPEVIGFIAGTVGFVCVAIQAVKAVISEETNAISLTTYYMFLIDYTVWVAYGLSLGSLPVLISNGACIPLTIAVILKKHYNISKKIDTE